MTSAMKIALLCPISNQNLVLNLKTKQKKNNMTSLGTNFHNIRDLHLICVLFTSFSAYV